MTSTKPTTFPSPIIFPPTSTIHKSTFIILHGRGSTAEKFAEPLLSHPVSPNFTSSTPLQNKYDLTDQEAAAKDLKPFQSYFPNTKFIFPTARLLRARAYNRSLTHQWFDNYPLDSYPPEYRSYIQVAGLRESIPYIHSLIEEAAQEIGAKNVVLIGLSQGCATALTSALLWEGEGLGTIVGMCGYLPFCKEMGEVCADRQGEGGSFEWDVEEEDEETEFEKVVGYLREELDLESFQAKGEGADARERGAPLKGTFVFLGHGNQDEKVPIKYGRQVVGLLRKTGVSLGWKEYDGLGHWYSADMLRDIVFILERYQH